MARPTGPLCNGLNGSSKTGENVGAFYTGRKSDGAWMSRPVLLQAGSYSWDEDRWGDYSATTIDPSDGSFWTVQEYSTPVIGYYWGTWITQIKAAP